MIKLMIVDDEEWIRYFLEHALAWPEIGIEVTAKAGDGARALEIIRKSCPDIVLTDIRMPLMDGVDLFTILRREFPRIRTIVISGYDDFSYAQNAVKAGVFEYLLKPVSKDSLESTILRAIKEINSEKSGLREKERVRKEIMKLRDSILEKEKPGEQPPQRASGQRPLDRAVAVINEEFSEPLTLQAVADKVYVNPQYLSSLFKEEFGIGFKRYLSNVRVCHAKKLIEYQSLKISEIAQLVGYEDANYFSKVFRKATGVLPSQYRSNPANS